MAIIHIFEQAGLGKAPFQFVDYFEKKGGFCDYCSHPITRHYGVRGVDGATFYVGSECIFKHGDEGLIDTVKQKIREIEREKRRIKAEAKRVKQMAERKAKEAEARTRQDRINALVEGKRAELMVLLADATSWLTDVLDTHTRSQFCIDISFELTTKFKLIQNNSPRCVAILADIWAKSRGRSGSNAYEAALVEFEAKVEETDKIISALADELNATFQAARLAA